ncbi:MAG: flavodoxin family protein [Deltaproteobacteria bacterium]|nr:flavodoxin family protein [Deltaproteobacteria bacterium]
MKSLIVYVSGHHNNTEQVARVLAKNLEADMKNMVLDTADAHNSYYKTLWRGRPHDRWNVTKLEQIDSKVLAGYDLIGFGSGAYYFKLHPCLFQFIDRFPPLKNKKAFIFTTSGLTSKFFVNLYHNPLKAKLQSKGFDVIGEFNCPGFDTFGAAKIIGLGGLKKGRPSVQDLKNAEAFAKKIAAKTNS